QDIATNRPPPEACSAETSPHSAHSVNPSDVFSTLQPTTTRPSSTRPAAPTGKREYGAYARRITSVAAARNAAQSTVTGTPPLHPPALPPALPPKLRSRRAPT